MDLLQRIYDEGKAQRCNPNGPAKEAYLDLAVNSFTHILNAERRSEVRNPVLIGGVALNRFHFQRYPRTSPDIDLETSMEFFNRPGKERLQVFGSMLQDTTALMRERARDLLGNDAVCDPVIEKLREPVDLDGKKYGTFKATLAVPSFLNFPRATVSIDLSPNDTTFDNPRKKVFKPSVWEGVPQESARIQTLENIIANKLFAVLNRFGYEVDAHKISRIKDLFDIWFIYNNAKVDPDNLRRIFRLRMALHQESADGEDEKVTRIIEAIDANPDQVLMSIVAIIKGQIEEARNMSPRDSLRRMTKSLKSSSQFPEYEELRNMLANTVRIVSE